MTVPSAASAGRTSLPTLAFCASTAKRLADRCIWFPVSCLHCGMKGTMCADPWSSSELIPGCCPAIAVEYILGERDIDLLQRE
jgi:hypothetical protein